MFCNNSGYQLTLTMLILYMLLQMFLYDTVILYVSLHFIVPNFPIKPNKVDIVHFYNVSDIHISNVKTCQLCETMFMTLLSDIIFSAIIDYNVDIVYIFPVLHLLQAMMKR